DLPSLTVSSNDAGRLRRGQGIILRGRDAPIMEGHVTVFAGADLVAIGDVQGAELRPHRVFQFAG
ncbi:MAG: tRNA pseudouridine(55) synthase TruB, partial [Rhabdaerophilum sp.]